MSLQNESPERLGGRKARYAVVGAGWVSQEDFMPGAGPTVNSVNAALVTGDAVKAKTLAASPNCIRTGKGTTNEFWQILLCVTIKRAFVK